ncbi:hypothetical protein BH20VER2_BH20VER2_17830 [soil metagenome]
MMSIIPSPLILTFSPREKEPLFARATRAGYFVYSFERGLPLPVGEGRGEGFLPGKRTQ